MCILSHDCRRGVEEGKRIAADPEFKGYIHDVGGPTADFRYPSCAKQMTEGMCQGGKKCLAPSPCPHVTVTHTEYLNILRRLRELPGVKKVFVRSAVRYDYMIYDKDETFFNELSAYFCKCLFYVFSTVFAYKCNPIVYFNGFAHEDVLHGVSNFCSKDVCGVTNGYEVEL